MTGRVIVLRGGAAHLPLPDASIHAVVCDPPYGLEFMGREWDTFKTGDGFRRSRNEADAGRGNVFGRTSRTSPEYITDVKPSAARIRERVDGRTNPASGKSTTRTPEAYVAGSTFQRWCEAWAGECLRVLKPGGYLLAFGGTRTWHRLVCGLEDAGFEIRESVADLTGYDAPGLMWTYGSGFPKSANVSRAIDRKMVPGETDPPVSSEGVPWSGWGTALKPGWEPIAVARKPLAGTVAANVLTYGTGALNIDGCRLDGVKDVPASPRRAPQGPAYGELGNDPGTGSGWDRNVGRWPPNVLLSEDAAAEMDRQSGITSETARTLNRNGARQMDGWGLAAESKGVVHGDSGGASRFFPVFRYEAKADASERPRLPDGTAWPTVKPVALMRWLVRLVTPPGGTILDPFCGTGPTGEAAIIEGFDAILLDKDPQAIALTRVRLAKPIQPLMFTPEPAAVPARPKLPASAQDSLFDLGEAS